MKMFPQLIKIFFTGNIVLLLFNVSFKNSSKAIGGTFNTSEPLNYFNELKPQLKNYEGQVAQMVSRMNKNFCLKV